MEVFTCPCGASVQGDRAGYEGHQRAHGSGGDSRDAQVTRLVAEVTALQGQLRASEARASAPAPAPGPDPRDAQIAELIAAVADLNAKVSANAPAPSET